jgi:hypothetical protein
VKKAIVLKLIKSKTARRVVVKAAMNPKVRKIIVDQTRRKVLGK